MIQCFGSRVAGFGLQTTILLASRSRDHGNLWFILIYFFLLYSKTSRSKLFDLLSKCPDFTFSSPRYYKIVIKRYRELYMAPVCDRFDLENRLRVLLQLFQTRRADRLFYKYQEYLPGNRKAHYHAVIQRNGRLTTTLNINESALLRKSLRRQLHATEQPIAYIPPVYRLARASLNQSHLEIIRFYTALFAALDREIVALRYQISWRAIPRAIEAPCIAYHCVFGEGIDNKVTVKESALHGKFTVDCRGYAGWHSINKNGTNSEKMDRLSARSSREAKEFCAGLQEKLLVNNESKYRQNITHAELPEKYFLLALQIPDDQVAQLAFIDTANLLNQVVQFCVTQNAVVVIKRHPLCTSKRIARLLARVSKLKNVHILDESILRLINRAHFVVTVNSGVGFESLIFGKRVLTTGLSDYTLGCHLARNNTQLKAQLQRLWMTTDYDDQAVSYIHYFFTRHLFDSGDFMRCEALKPFLKGIRHA
jgi:hypothetical protein